MDEVTEWEKFHKAERVKPAGRADALRLQSAFIDGARWMRLFLTGKQRRCSFGFRHSDGQVIECDRESGHLGDHFCGQTGMSFSPAPDLYPEGALIGAAERNYRAPTRAVWVTAEDPENPGWYWRVRDGQLEINFISDDEKLGDEFWQPYSPAATPGLLPTKNRCETWSKLFAKPSTREPLP